MSRSFRQRIGAAVATAGLVAIGAALTAGASYAEVPDGGACNGSFQGTPPGSLELTTVPPSGSNVKTGDLISVTATWDTGDWESLDKADICVTVGGELDLALSDIEKPADNDGSYQHAFTIPAETAVDTEVCIRAQVHGIPGASEVSTQKSNVACFTVFDPGTTTTTAPTTTTTTAPTTTTTTAPTTTTTTAPSTTVTTAPPSVLGEQLQNPAVDPQVVGTELPRTGGGSRSLVLLAGWALLLGGLALAFGEAGGVSPAGDHA
jgi:hypothetical protein